MPYPTNATPFDHTAPLPHPEDAPTDLDVLYANSTKALLRAAALLARQASKGETPEMIGVCAGAAATLYKAALPTSVRSSKLVEALEKVIERRTRTVHHPDCASLLQESLPPPPCDCGAVKTPKSETP